MLKHVPEDLEEDKLTWAKRSTRRLKQGNIGSVILGRKVLESVGWEKWNMLEAACLKHRGVIDAAETLRDDKNGESEPDDIDALF